MLHLAQEELGYITDAAMKWIASKLGIEPINVYEVVTFYPMFRLAPIGRRHVKVCRTLSCALRGSYKTMEALEKEFGCKRGETSADGNVTLEFVECLACCGTGPIVQVDHLFYEKVTPDAVPALAKKFAIRSTTRITARPRRILPTTCSGSDNFSPMPKIFF